jgi:hypothetical protein
VNNSCDGGEGRSGRFKCYNFAELEGFDTRLQGRKDGFFQKMTVSLATKMVPRIEKLNMLLSRGCSERSLVFLVKGNDGAMIGLIAENRGLALRMGLSNTLFLIDCAADLPFAIHLSQSYDYSQRQESMQGRGHHATWLGPKNDTWFGRHLSIHWDVEKSSPT